MSSTRVPRPPRSAGRGSGDHLDLAGELALFLAGIVSGQALGLTPLVYLAAGLFFALTAMTYLEGAAMHPERAGSTVFARYAFNELVSFVAAAAVLLDYVILIAICALTATDYLATFVPAIGHGGGRVMIALAIIAYGAVTNVLGVSALRRWRRILAMVAVDIVLQLVVVVIGLVLFFNLGRSPTTSTSAASRAGPA